MEPGDLIQLRKINSTGRTMGVPQLLGILLEPPKFPTYGNFPKSYTVLTPNGVKTFSQQTRQLIERVPEDGNAAR